MNYYEHGIFLTLNHAHTARFGAFGLLAIGLVYFCLRYTAGDRVPFSARIGIWAFWLYNAGLVLWIVLNFFPIGWPQLDAVFEHGLAYARSVEFYKSTPGTETCCHGKCVTKPALTRLICSYMYK